MKKYYSILCIAFFSAFLFSCRQSDTSLSTSEAETVKAGVLKLADSTAKDISTKGPMAWLDHFEDSPGFFMASGGSLAFPDYHSAQSFIKGKLVKVMSKINLKWSDIRVDALTPQIAIMGAGFHEDVIDPTGKITPYDGYFTGTVRLTEKGWKFRDEHWSIKPGK